MASHVFIKPRTPSWRRIPDRAHDTLFRFAQMLWLPLIEAVGSRLYQRALARSKRM